MGVIRIDHPSYLGYRVQRNAAGETRRRYYALRIVDARTERTRNATRREEAAIRREAEAYDAELTQWQQKARRATVRSARPLRPGNNTGVRGIVFRPDHAESRRGRVYRFPALAVSILDTQGKAITRRIRVEAKGEEDAWRAACRIVADAKNIRAASLYKRFPARVITLKPPRASSAKAAKRASVARKRRG